MKYISLSKGTWEIFDNVSKDEFNLLKTHLPLLIPKTFDLNTIFEIPRDSLENTNKEKEFGGLVKSNEPNNSEIRCIIGFYKTHFVNYSQVGKDKWLFIDCIYTEVGSFNDVITHMQSEKVIPYITILLIWNKQK